MNALLASHEAIVVGKPPAFYDATGRTLHARHGTPTPHVETAAQSSARRSKRKAQRNARKRNR